jgi:hypothetical protein
MTTKTHKWIDHNKIEITMIIKNNLMNVLNYDNVCNKILCDLDPSEMIQLSHVDRYLRKIMLRLCYGYVRSTY